MLRRPTEVQGPKTPPNEPETEHGEANQPEDQPDGGAQVVTYVQEVLSNFHAMLTKMTFPRLDNEYSLTKFRRSAVWGKFIRLFTGQGLNDPAKGVGQLRPVRVRIQTL